MSVGDWLIYGPAVLLVLFVVVRAAAAGDEDEREGGERPLFGDEAEEERDRE